MKTQCLHIAQGEAGGVAPLVEFLLHTSDHHHPELFQVVLRQCRPLLESHRVEHLQKTAEGGCISVVGGCGEEQPMLEVRDDIPEHGTAVAVVRKSGGREIVSFIHDEEVPGEHNGILGEQMFRSCAELVQDILLFEVIHGGDDPGIHRPWIRIDPRFTLNGIDLF